MQFVIILLLILFLVLLAIAAYFTVFAIKPNVNSVEKQLAWEQEYHHLDPALAEIPFERWEIRSKRGTKLAARFYPNGNNEKIMLVNHGYNSPWISMLKYLEMLQELGFACLLPDHQAEGDSEGKWITFGVLESEDGLCWLEEISRRYPQAEKSVLGESLGGATTLLIAEKAKDLRFCVADCPYNDMADELSYMGRRKYHLPMSIIMPLAKLWFKLLTGRSMEESSPLRLLDELNIPTLLVHGDKDHTVPVEMSRELAKRNANITYWEVPEAPHASVVALHPEEYKAKVAELMEKSAEKQEVRA